MQSSANVLFTVNKYKVFLSILCCPSTNLFEKCCSISSEKAYIQVHSIYIYSVLFLIVFNKSSHNVLWFAHHPDCFGLGLVQRHMHTYSLNVPVSGSSVITSCSASTQMLMMPQNLSWITLVTQRQGRFITHVFISSTAVCLWDTQRWVFVQRTKWSSRASETPQKATDEVKSWQHWKW